MKFPPFLHSHLRLTLLGTPPNRVFLLINALVKPLFIRHEPFCCQRNSLYFSCQPINLEDLKSVANRMLRSRRSVGKLALIFDCECAEEVKCCVCYLDGR